MRELGGCGHSVNEHLTLLLQHTLAVANWQRAHGKKATQPKPLDCMLPEDLRESRTYGKASMSLDDAADWLGWDRDA